MRRIERNWDPWETAWLVQNAHRTSLEDVCTYLGRSEASVKSKAKRLRAAGKDVGPLRKCGTTPALCPECGELRRRFAGDTCRACAEREKARRTMAEIARLGGDVAGRGSARPPAKPGESDAEAEDREEVYWRRVADAARQRLRTLRKKM